jgi:hypothetical protein
MNGKWENYASISNKARKTMRPQVSQHPAAICNKNPHMYGTWNEITGIYWIARVLCTKLNGYRDNGKVVKNELLIATYIFTTGNFQFLYRKHQYLTHK